MEICKQIVESDQMLCSVVYDLRLICICTFCLSNKKPIRHIWVKRNTPADSYKTNQRLIRLFGVLFKSNDVLIGTKFRSFTTTDHNLNMVRAIPEKKT